MPDRKFSQFSEQASIAAGLEVYVHDPSQTSLTERDRRMLLATLLAGTTGGLSLSRVGAAASVTFAARTFVATGRTVPGSATWLLVACSIPEIRGAYAMQLASLWRGLSESTAGAAVTDANGIPVHTVQRGTFGLQVRLGRTAANEVLIAYAGGRTGLAAGTVEIYTA